MTETEAAYLALFTPATHEVEIPRVVAGPMEERGWITWVPPAFGTRLWAITEAGRRALGKERARADEG